MGKVVRHFRSNRKSSTLVVFILLLAVVFGIGFYGDKLPFIQKSSYQVLAPSPTPETKPTTISYSNNQFGFKFDYPEGWQVNEIDSTKEKTVHSILQLTPTGFKGAVPPIKLFNIPNPKNLSLSDLEKTLTSKNQGIAIVYAPDDAYTLSGGGIPAYFRNSGNCVTAKCQIYTFSQGDQVFQLVSFVEINANKQSVVFGQIFNSLKFNQPN